MAQKPQKCPECRKMAIFIPIGLYRAQCPECWAVVKNAELHDIIKED